MANWLSRAWKSLTRATEGAYRPGPYPLNEGWLSATAGRYLNWWQMGYSLAPGGEASAMVEACVSAYAQTVAMCPGDHWIKLDNGGRERVAGSALSRIIRSPNDYQSISDFLLNLTRRLYSQGEAFALAVRNARGEIAELHLMRHGSATIGEDGSVFYSLWGNEVVERRFDLSFMIPARDVLHVRLHTPMHVLKGVSPILSTTLDQALAGAALNQQITFYLNEAKPSFMLETDEKLSRDQVALLRQLWNDQTRGEATGGTPILTAGLKAKPVATAPKDSQLAEMLQMGDQKVALAFRIPLQILGVGGTPFASTEALMSSWKASGLGFALNHIEEAFGQLFRLRGYPDEYLELNTNALMRSSFKEMLDALTSGTHRVMTPNEARRHLDLPALAGGEEILVQQQDIPLSMAGKALDKPAAPEAPAPEKDADVDAGRADPGHHVTRLREAAAEARRRVPA